jgi:DNA helicase-4
MALISCPECNKSISDKSVSCPHCGLPSSYFNSRHAHDEVASDNQKSQTINPINYNEMRNMLVSFEKDYNQFFTTDRYISSREVDNYLKVYNDYKMALDNPLIKQYIKTNAASLRIDDIQLEKFHSKMQSFTMDVEVHNTNFINRKMEEYREYFDNLLKDVDENIRLDEEQRKAVLTDDNHCLLVAGAGAGKTTTMAAKVKYLVDKQGVNPEDIIVISYTNKAIDELKDRINKKLRIPAKINTFHSFAFEIVKKSSTQIPEVNFYAYHIISPYVRIVVV